MRILRVQYFISQTERNMWIVKIWKCRKSKQCWNKHWINRNELLQIMILWLNQVNFAWFESIWSDWTRGTNQSLLHPWLQPGHFQRWTQYCQVSNLRFINYALIINYLITGLSIILIWSSSWMYFIFNKLKETWVETLSPCFLLLATFK